MPWFIEKLPSPLLNTLHYYWSKFNLAGSSLPWI